MTVRLTHGLVVVCSLTDLTSRFEPPDDRNRWDRPLIKVDPSKVRGRTWVARINLLHLKKPYVYHVISYQAKGWKVEPQQMVR
jgi:hypothetical protein